MLQDLHGRVALIAGKTLRKLPLSRALNVTTDGGGASSSSTTMTATLKRSLTWVDLIGFGVGCVVGAGIFVLMGYASSTAAGPAVMLSFALDFVVCLLAGLCYAEFAARHPIAGSSYSYTYISVGELPAFFVGWTLAIANIFSIATVARGFAGYFNSLVGNNIPQVLVSVKFGIFDLNAIALLVTLLLTLYMLLGIRQSSWLNLIITGVSLATILLVIVLGCFKVSPSNWSDFFPFGVQGVFDGAALVFFAYIGFEVIANFSEEVENPSRDIPIGIVGSLVICSSLYVAVSAVLTGMLPYSQLDPDAPLARAFEAVGWSWASYIISLGAIAGLTTTVLVSLLSTSRVIFAISRDGLLPSVLSCVYHRTNGTVVADLLVGTVASLLAFAIDTNQLADVSSMGILLAFVSVSFSVFLLRLSHRRAASPEDAGRTVPPATNDDKRPFVVALLLAVMAGTLTTSLCVRFDAPAYVSWPVAASFLLPSIVLVGFYQLFVHRHERSATFELPAMPLIPLSSLIANVYMIGVFPAETWILFSCFLLVGALCYIFYGYHHSLLNQPPQSANDGSIATDTTKLVE